MKGLQPLAALLLGWAACTAAPAAGPAANAPAPPPLPAQPVTTQAAPAPTAPSPTADGSGVLDPRARTVWARCVEGMRWNGSTCTGQALLLTRAEATARAKARSAADGRAWRLPRTLELRRLVDRQATPPGLDRRLFPAAPGGLHWSGSASVRRLSANPYNYDNVASGRKEGNRLAALEGWAVDMDTGEAIGDVARSSRLPVRLVRGAD